MELRLNYKPILQRWNSEMTANEERVRSVVSLLEKFDFGVRKYLDWITCVKKIDGKAHIKAESKGDFEKWRIAFFELARRTSVEAMFTKENTFDLKFLSFTISVQLNSHAVVERIILAHPAFEETDLDVAQDFKSPQDVTKISPFVELLKSLSNASRDDNAEILKIIHGLMSISNDIYSSMVKSVTNISPEVIMSSRLGQVLPGKSCFLRPSMIYYCHVSHPLHCRSPELPKITEYRSYVSFAPSTTSFNLQVARGVSPNALSYAPMCGVYLLTLEQPLLVSFVVFRKIQDLCRSSGVLQFLKTCGGNNSNLPSMREATPVFPRTLLNTSGSDRIMQCVPSHNLRLAISVQWERDSSNSFDPCYWLEAVPFCDAKNLARIIHLLRLQQRFNSLLLNSCDITPPTKGVDSSHQQLCLPLNITVNSLTSFSLKCRHPLEARFIHISVSFAREFDDSFNKPKISLQDIDSLLPENTPEAQQSFMDSIVEVFRSTWSLSSVAAFIWQSFLPYQADTVIKEESNFFDNNMAMSPSAFSDGQSASQNSSASKARRVSILEEILSEADASANNIANNSANCTGSTGAAPPSSVDPTYSPTYQQRLLSSSSWLPNSSNITSFEPPIVSNTAPPRPTNAPAQRGRPRKSLSGILPGAIPSAMPPATNSAARSPAGSSKKRLSLPPVSEVAEPDLLSAPTSLTVPGKNKQPGKRGRRVSTSPSTSSPAFSMQPSPVGSTGGLRHVGDFSNQGLSHNSQHGTNASNNGDQSQTPLAMTPAFTFPSEYAAEESESVQSSPSDDKLPPAITEESNTDACDEKGDGFPSPPVLMQEHPARPASEEDEKGLVICEPGGYDASPMEVFGDCESSPPMPMAARIPSRPPSSLSDNNLRLSANHRLHQRVLLSSDESEQSSSNSLPEERGSKISDSHASSSVSTSRYNTGLSPGFSDSSRSKLDASGPQIGSGSTAVHRTTFNKPGGVKLLGLNDLFDMAVPPGTDVSGPGQSTLSRNQQARAALDRVLCKNRTDNAEDAFAFNERDPVPLESALKAGARPTKRPAPNTLTGQKTAKPGVPAGTTQRQRTTSKSGEVSGDERPKPVKQRKIDEPGAAGSTTGDPAKMKDKVRSDNAKSAADFTRPLPTGLKIPKKTTPVATAPGDGSQKVKSQVTPKNKTPQNQQQTVGSSNQTSAAAATAGASAANPLSTFRIPKKTPTNSSAPDSSGSSSAKKPASSSATASSHNTSKNTSSSGGQSSRPVSTDASAFRQRTNSFDGSKEKSTPVFPSPTAVPEPTPIPLSASYPQLQKTSSGPDNNNSQQPQSLSRSLQHHKSQPEFSTSAAPGATSSSAANIPGSVGEAMAGGDRRRAAVPDSSQPRPPGSGAPPLANRKSSGHRLSGSSNAGPPTTTNRSNAPGQRYDSQAPSAARRPPSSYAPASAGPDPYSLSASVGTSGVSSSGSSTGGSYPQPPPAHQRLPSSSQMPGGNRSFPAHSSGFGPSTGDYSYAAGGAGGGGSGGGGGGGGSGSASWYENSGLGGSNYRSFFDHPSGEAPIQSPEPFGQQPFDNPPPVIIATSPVRQHPPAHSNNSNSGNYF